MWINNFIKIFLKVAEQIQWIKDSIVQNSMAISIFMKNEWETKRNKVSIQYSELLAISDFRLLLTKMFELKACSNFIPIICFALYLLNFVTVLQTFHIVWGCVFWVFRGYIRASVVFMMCLQKCCNLQKTSTKFLMCSLVYKKNCIYS